jgi:hypothetical protein
MSETVEQMRLQLAEVRRIRRSGVREVRSEAKSVGYAAGDDLAAVEADLERRIEAAEGRRRRVLRTYAVKDL